MPPAPPPDAADPVVVARAPAVAGGELVLRRAGEHWEIIDHGVFLMDTRDGASERELVRAALAAVPTGRRGLRVLIGGLGVGFSARAALDAPRVGAVEVVELEPEVIAWHRGPLAAVGGGLADDPRCTLTCADVLARLAAADRPDGPRFDAVCLDVDNGPDWTVAEGNRRLYAPAALDRIGRVLRPGGAVAFWSAMPAPAFAGLLERRFGAVEAIEVAARRGGPDLVYVARSAG
jgi:spermidine synthase